MKLNNKGFAITAVLYGLLILFVLLVSSYLVILSAKKDRVETLVNDIEEKYIIDQALSSFSFPFTVPSTGIYVFNLTSSSTGAISQCTTELSTDDVIILNNNLKVNDVYIVFEETVCSEINNNNDIASVNKIMYVSS